MLQSAVLLHAEPSPPGVADDQALRAAAVDVVLRLAPLAVVAADLRVELLAGAEDVRGLAGVAELKAAEEDEERAAKGGGHQRVDCVHTISE